MLNWLTTTLFGKILFTMLISMVPVIELRGGVPFGVALGLSPWLSFLICVTGNMIPVPFIILFIRRIFEWLKTRDKFKSTIEKLEQKAHLKGKKVQKYKVFGLFIFVAIPLPGTGAWTGALIAAILDMRLKAAIPPIFLGVLTAGLLVTGITYGFTAIF